MAQPSRTSKFLLLVLFCTGIFLGFSLSHWFGSGDTTRRLSTPAMLQQIKALSQLVTVEYTLEKIESVEVPSQNLVGQMIGSENRVLMLAHGTVKAGIDLQRLKPEDLRVSDKTVFIKLPHAQITDAYLDDNLTKVIDRKTGLLAPPAKDLEQLVRQFAVDDIRRAARECGILKDAEERAKIQIKTLFIQLGFEKVEFDTASSSPPLT